MKKVLSVLMIVILLSSCLFVLTGCTGKDEENLAQQENNEQEVVQVDEEELDGFLGTKTGKFYSKFNAGKMYMEYEMEVEGQKMSVVTATNGKKIYSETKTAGVAATTIMEEGVLYTIDHTSKMIIKMKNNMPDTNTLASTIIEESSVDMNNFVKGTREIDGKTYETEEMDIDGTKGIMCFEGDDLKYMISSVDGEEYMMKIVEVSDKVDDKLFEFPTGYQVFEM